MPSSPCSSRKTPVHSSACSASLTIPFYRFSDLTEIRHGQVWRLISPILIHFGIMHILFNVLMLRDLGSLIEVRRGMLLMGALVLVSAIVSNLAQYWWSGPGFGGLSGVVYALFGYAWMQSRLFPQRNIQIHPDTVFIMLAWLVLCMTGWVGDIANTAHVVGLLVGMAIGAAPYAWKRR